MNYMLLIYEAEQIWENKTQEEKQLTLKGHTALRARLEADDISYSGLPLAPTSTATVIRMRRGKRDISDGPFAETTEQLAGFYVIDCLSLDDALEYASLIPNYSTGSIEVRPAADHCLPTS